MVGGRLSILGRGVGGSGLRVMGSGLGGVEMAGGGSTCAVGVG